MRLITYCRTGQWSTVLGYLLFVALMVAGYYYNLTLVQLGLLAIGFGAVLNTYFGLKRFEPVTIPGGTHP